MDILMIGTLAAALIAFATSIGVYATVCKFKKEQASLINELRKIGYEVHKQQEQKDTN